jgi:hypothetical protein
MYQKHNIKSNKDFDSPPFLFSLEPFFFSVYHAKGNKKKKKMNKGVSDDFKWEVDSSHFPLVKDSSILNMVFFSS